MVYGCNNHEPRPAAQVIEVQDGWTEDGRRKMTRITSKWQPVVCGHNFREVDLACSGCRWRVEIGAD